jgi:DNA-directed RNA polymerase specialized sigma24 family protein
MRERPALEAELAEHRAHLFAIAYRMLGSAAEADDVLQEAAIRWAQHEGDVGSPRAFLTTVVVRLCLDQLKSARAKRETYVGPWLPEPILERARTDDVAPRADAGAELVDVNGEPGLLLRNGRGAQSVLTLSVSGDRIHDVWIVVNPDKLARYSDPGGTGPLSTRSSRG